MYFLPIIKLTLQAKWNISLNLLDNLFFYFILYQFRTRPSLAGRCPSCRERSSPPRRLSYPRSLPKTLPLPTSAALTSPVKPRPWSCRPRSAECPRRLSFVRPAVLSASPHSNNDDLRRTIAVAASAQSAPLASQRHFSPLKLLWRTRRLKFQAHESQLWGILLELNETLGTPLPFINPLLCFRFSTKYLL